MNYGLIQPPYPVGRPVLVAAMSAMSVQGTQIYPPGRLDTYGNGRWRIITDSNGWTVPVGVKFVRARTIGLGGSVRSAGSGCSGAAGGGFAIGEFRVAPGQIIATTVPAVAVNGGDGGTVLFGPYLQSTGGQGSNAVTTARAGGTGFGGDFQAQGGSSAAGAGSGGGAAGSQLGNGGPGAAGGGGGAVGGCYGDHGGASPFGNAISHGGDAGGPDPLGAEAYNALAQANGTINAMNAVIRFPFDGFTGGGGSSGGSSVAGGSGGPGCGGGRAGTNMAAGDPGWGGGGGAGRGSTLGAAGTIGGGSGGCGTASTGTTPGSIGIIIVEW